jgi:hypothetical protein
MNCIISYKATSLLCLSLFFFSTSFAQIDIKSKVDAQTYADYSKAIDLFEKNINPNDVATIFIAKNYAVVDRLAQYQAVFVAKDNSAINSFINHHTIQKYIAEVDLRQDVINSNIDRTEKFKSNDTYHFVKNDILVMLTDKASFEANIEKAIQINSNVIVYFIQSVVKY